MKTHLRKIFEMWRDICSGFMANWSNKNIILLTSCFKYGIFDSQKMLKRFRILY
ncbi:hypothetical protein MtrunA17_Chr4g0019711 [Medicago truncatula]|uniref:Uncharacterized protein n=1 Tax=Medicago truncatula TaxID=3880 RepID=A0A396I2U3_MEDTR|nr:hypothetical protein MtrunA17_Chr4g0019711 [Medicago truncatula]